MSSYFNCCAYADVKSTIRLDGQVVFLALEEEAKNISVHLTLNPFQIRTLNHYLSIALTKINFVGLANEENFGDLTVEIEDETLTDEEGYSMAVPF